MKAGSIALATFATACALPPSEVAWFGKDDADPDLPIDNPAKPDVDQDGWSADEGDCDDTNEYVGPWELEKTIDFYEQCDNLDNDCDGVVDVIVSEDERHVCARQAIFEQSLMVDFAVFFVKADGSARPKVFKLRRVTLPARATVTLNGTISFAVHSTRTPRPGRHAIEARVNGAAFPLGSVTVLDAAPPRRARGSRTPSS